MKSKLYLPLILTLIFMTVATPGLKANEFQYNALNAGICLGWVEAQLELAGITAGNTPLISGALSAATGYNSTMNGLLWGPYQSLDLSRLNPEILNFFQAAQRLTPPQRVNYIRNIYNKLRMKLSNAYDSRRGLFSTPTCDSYFLTVGYHFGKAFAGAAMGNSSYVNANQGAINRAIADGLKTSVRLNCGFGVENEWRSLPWNNPLTIEDYTATLYPLQLIAWQASGETQTPPPPGAVFSPAGSNVSGPLSLNDILNPTNTILRGQWASAKRSGNDAREANMRLTNGLFTHPGAGGPTEVVYNHDGSPRTFSGYVTVLDGLNYEGRAGSVIFYIVADGRTIWQSGMMYQRSQPARFSINLSGVRELRLVTTDGGNGTAEDWAAWVNMDVR